MNDVQSLIDRQLGSYIRLNYDNILKRLVVNGEESFYGLQNAVVATVYDQDPPIFACRFSEAPGYEHILALANEDGKVAIQDTNTPISAGTLEGFQCHNNAVFDLAWMPGHMNFVTVSGDHTACLWDIAEDSPKRISIFSSHSRSVKTAVFRPQAPSVFATGARDGHILVWDVRASNLPCVVLKPDNCLMNCHSSFTPKTPGSTSKRPRIDHHRATSITGLVFQDDISLISCGECDGNIKVWDLRKNYNIYKREPLPKHSIPYCGSSTKNGYTNLIIDDARTRLYASCMDNVIYCFNISTYNTLPEQRYIGHENSTFYIKTSLSADCMYLVSGSSDKNAYIWNVKYSEPIVKLAGHWAEVTCAAWCQKGDMKIVTCSDDARHKIWRIGFETPGDEWELKGKAEVVPYSEKPLPQWGTLDRTPSSLKRKLPTTPSSYSAKRLKPQESTSKKTKRCLTDLLNSTKEDPESVKRLKGESPGIIEEDRLLPAGIKRHSDLMKSPRKKQCTSYQSTSNGTEEWREKSERSTTDSVTPIKNYERRPCLKLSPKSPKINSSNKSPVKISPSKVRILSFNTPTKNLPNFVLNGEAPHLRLMSPVKKKETTNWLTQMGKKQKGKVSSGERAGEAAGTGPGAGAGPGADGQPRRAARGAGGRTLLTYFNVRQK